jgi:two-component system response regulator FlrC
MTAFGTVENAVRAIREGAVEYLVKPFAAQDLVSVVHRIMSSHSGTDQEPVAVDRRTREQLQLAKRVAGSEATVMIYGESGTGKEVVAHYIHDCSQRRDKPFIAINCAAIPENMLEATLFGYEKGAFTGAYKASPGKFELAQGGTLLLDEVSEMDLALQAKLLRVLQEKEVERLGGHDTIVLDVRVLATTNRRLREDVAAGRFREDLFYRLNVFPLCVPPLRERPDDILPITQRLLQRHLAKGSPMPHLGAGVEELLRTHSWPGNVRELENVVQRALIMHVGDEIKPVDFQFETEAMVVAAPAPVSKEASIANDEGGLGDDLKSHEDRLILEALLSEHGSRKNAATKLGISPRTLRYKLARMREAGVVLPG